MLQSEHQRVALRWALVGLLLSVGLGLRAWRINDEPLWVDEAESSINGLTILQHGLPVDHYLGLPIYENVMIEPWEGNPEYEFKDLSYSDRGLAVYHGWLPLYSIALSEWLFGVTADEASSPALHDEQAMLRRTWVPRVPSLVFSFFFLLFLYLTARSMAGEAAGLAALTFAAVGDKFVWFGFQARYYSGTLCFDALCAYALWMCVREGRRRDYLLLGVATLLLFHTHVVSCLAVLATAAVLLPVLLRQERFWIHVSWAAGIFLVGTLPWAWLSGLIGHTQRVPAARELMVFPDDLIAFVRQRADAFLLLLLSVASILGVLRLNRRHRWLTEQDATAYRQAFHLTAGWLVVAYAMFFLLMPAASFYWVRMTMTLETPGLLLIAVGLAAIAKVAVPRYAPLATVAVMLAFLLWSGRFSKSGDKGVDAYQPLFEVAEHLVNTDWREDTKFYAAPNFHLTLSYYTGLPIQSIAPIRAEFLDSYPGPLVLVMPFFLMNGRELEEVVWQAAEQAGRTPDLKSLSQWKSAVNQRLYFERMRPRVASISPEPVIPEFLEPAMEAIREFYRSGKTPPWVSAECPVMVRGFSIKTFEQWWVHYFYRFVNPTARLEEQANFARRMQGARIALLTRGYSVWYAAALSDEIETPDTHLTNSHLPDSELRSPTPPNSR